MEGRGLKRKEHGDQRCEGCLRLRDAGGAHRRGARTGLRSPLPAPKVPHSAGRSRGDARVPDKFRASSPWVFPQPLMLPK